jgi:hypothetical protein
VSEKRRLFDDNGNLNPELFEDISKSLAQFDYPDKLLREATPLTPEERAERTRILREALSDVKSEEESFKLIGEALAEPIRAIMSKPTFREHMETAQKQRDMLIEAAKKREHALPPLGDELVWDPLARAEEVAAIEEQVVLPEDSPPLTPAWKRLPKLFPGVCDCAFDAVPLRGPDPDCPDCHGTGNLPDEAPEPIKTSEET